jgi:uncharacterized membrane protein
MVKKLTASPAVVQLTGRRMAWGTALILFVIYGLLSVLRHHQMLTTGYDLGIFEQEVRSYAAGHWPTSLLKGPDYPLLGDHFSPIVATIAPFYLVFPRVETLLIAQALLVAVGVVPLMLWARRSVGFAASIIIGVGYGLSWGIAEAVKFDFHEIAFAVPLLAFSLSALGQGRLRSAVLWAAPLMLVKEDLGLTLAVIGALVAWRGARAWGIAAAALGIVATVVEMRLIIPLVNPDGANAYTGQVRIADAFDQLLGFPTNVSQLTTIMLMLAPTAFLAVRSPLVLAVVPTLLWRFLSDNIRYWGTSFHYSAVLMPIVFAAFIDALVRLRGRRRPWLAASGIVTAVLFLSSPLLQLLQPSLWVANPRISATSGVLARIPDGATVAASNSLVPQLTARADVSLLGMTPLEVSHPEYIVADTEQKRQYPIGAVMIKRLLVDAERGGYTSVYDEDNLTLLRRN